MKKSKKVFGLLSEYTLIAAIMFYCYQQYQKEVPKKYYGSSIVDVSEVETISGNDIIFHGDLHIQGGGQVFLEGRNIVLGRIIVSGGTSIVNNGFLLAHGYEKLDSSFISSGNCFSCIGEKTDLLDGKFYLIKP